ncbi:MAG: multidrug ABC transporter ATP-binding protein [Desulfurococcales archaeon ex4484_58]|nr:MAG: multidrug ABC transporter ATP-binding protein [Desulfurococcales archaeon ex4484_58]
MDLLVVNDLVKIYPGNVEALRGISFKVEPGEVYGLIGPNGAGKTTTLRIIATILEPTHGEVYVDGYSVVDQPDEVRRRISYLPEEAGAYKYLTGLEFLEFIAKIYTDDPRLRSEMIRDALAISGLGERIKDKIRTYSKGMLRRLLVAKTLMVKPKLALLDEPTAGLDVLNAQRIRYIIKEYAKKHGIAVLLSSHNMLEVEYLCDRIGILYRGKLIVEGSPKKLIEEYKVVNLEELFTKLIGEQYESF